MFIVDVDVAVDVNSCVYTHLELPDDRSTGNHASSSPRSVPASVSTHFKSGVCQLNSLHHKRGAFATLPSLHRLYLMASLSLLGGSHAGPPSFPCQSCQSCQLWLTPQAQPQPQSQSRSQSRSNRPPTQIESCRVEPHRIILYRIVCISSNLANGSTH